MPLIGYGILRPAEDTTHANLLEIKKRVVLESGRFDLVTDAEADDWTDDGRLTNYINAAQKWLDRKIHSDQFKQTWLYAALTTDQPFVTFLRPRVISEVYVVSNGTRYPLRPKSFFQMHDLEEEYSAVPVTSIESGEPCYYVPVPVGLNPTQLDATQESFDAADLSDGERLYFGQNYPLYRGILLVPPPTTGQTLEVLADWYSPTLVNDSDVSFWTVTEPDLLVMATLRRIEVSMRNSQGRKDYSEEIYEQLADIERGLIAEEMAGPPDLYKIGG